MAQDNSNTTVELGNNDQQALIASRRKKTIGYVVGTAVGLVVLGGIVALIVVFSGGESEPAATTTVAPTTVTSGPDDTTTVNPDDTTTINPDDTTTINPDDTTTINPDDTTTINPDDTTIFDPDETTTESPTTTSDPTEEPTPPPTTPEPPPPLDLEEFINGAFSPPPFNATWSAGSEMLYRDSNGDLVLYDVDTDSTLPLITNTSSQILQQSPRVTQLSADGEQVILAYSDTQVYRHSFVARYAAYDIITGQTVHIAPSNVNRDTALLQNFVWGPTGTALAFVYLNNIYYQSDLSSTPRQITTDGRLDEIYNGITDWVYEEEVFFSSNAIWFSKDGTNMAFASFDDTEVRKIKVPHYGVPGSVDSQYTLHNGIPYPKAGTTNPTVSVTLLDVNTDVRTVYTAPTIGPILKTVKFVTDTSISLVWTNRVQNQMTIQLCTAGQSACTVIFSHSETTRNGWIESVPLFFNDAGTSFITILPQEVNGVLYKQIVQASQPTGNAAWTPQNRVNKAHTVLEILAWTSDGIIWYKATGEQDTAEQHIYTLNPAGEVSCFTCAIQREDGGQCLYNEATLSNSGDRITINCAGPDVPQILIYATDGTLVRVWDDRAELSDLTSSRGLPIKFQLTLAASADLPGGADVLIQAPADYASRDNVPLLVYVYGGPDTALVTRRWSLDWGSSLVSRWGIAIAHIDGRGSGRRGVTNMFAVNRNLGTVEVQDQITVTKYLQDNLSWINSTRTCIWGWSYGGYAASKALSEGGDVFRCAAAVAPVTDWRFYDTIYTERYMGQPSENEQGYATSSLNTDQVAESLRDKRYFLIHGTEDDNVHYQHAMILSRRLQRQNVYFNQMSYTDEAHGLAGVQPHLYHALEEFFEENLLN